MEYITELTSLFFDIALFAVAFFAALIALSFLASLSFVVVTQIFLSTYRFWESFKRGFKRERNK